ncbi:hypothetical protein SUGI_0599130 [Cryptomeria japonica]|nr:hypothetical protein SUGI_0599130 [Cryptomeria japonica]
MHLKSWSIKSGQERVRGFVVGSGSGTEIHTFEAMLCKIRASEKLSPNVRWLKGLDSELVVIDQDHLFLVLCCL